MSFFDESRIYIKSGNGGTGACSFRREANVPFGGPNGGDGGNGGNVIVKVNTHLNTLIDFKFKQHYKAENGQNGGGRDCHGRNGKDIILKVPLGTQIFDEEENLLVDLDEKNKEFTIAKGGHGGRGNASYKTSTNRAPRKFEQGEITEEQIIFLKLKIISDVGLVGFPNAGKSTLISVVSNAKPKIADYPFTTLKPNLGVVLYDDKDFVIADIPGLIKGASEGHGLGHRFLKHVERCKTIIHLIDINCDNPIDSYKIIRKELEKYSKFLADKKEIIVLNKIDLIDKKSITQIKNKLQKATKKTVFTISAVAKINLNQLKQQIISELID